MEFIESVFKGILLIAALMVIVGAMAALFMVMFGIATGIDDKMQ